MWIEILNLLVTLMGVLMSLGHFPQAYKIYKRKSSKDISLVTYSIFTFGSIIWLAYGITLNQLPIVITFIIAVIGTLSVMILALKYR
ncbi:hypothetical protein J4422_02130 [Candidatus Pacearchaeota archaeon]|nr:hypothetical protein [Candidatus Pacearchaeota archaeon]